METVQDLSGKILTVAHNPALMQSLALNTLRQSLNKPNMTLADPTDPVAYIAEMGVMLAHSTIEGGRQLLPKMYASMALTWDDLYRHMSDRDAVDIFSQPSTTEMYLYVDVDSVRAKAMPLVSAGTRRIIIPRDSYVKVAGYTFTLQYAIEIQVLPFDSFEVLWVTSPENPVKEIATNALDWVLTTADNGTSMLRITLPLMQYAITTATDVILPKTGWKKNYPFTNKFFYARVWMRNSRTANKWTELAQTFSKEVYDPNIPTAVMALGTQVLGVKIPEVYINSGLVSGDIRVDVYTTLGPLSVDLANYPADDFQMFMADLNEETDPTYSNPFKMLSVRRVLGSNLTVGGRNPLTLEEFRDRVISNSVGARKQPISEAQLAAAVTAYGLSLTKPIDYVTNRTYHLSAPMPDSTLKDVSSPIGTLSAPMYFTWEELAALSTVRFNGNRATILPETIYRSDGTSLFVDPTMTEGQRYLSNRDLVAMANASSYFYTPFHYVVDRNNDALDVRVYQLSKPAIISKRFMSTNSTTELQVVTDNYEIVRTETGYKLRVVTRSSEAYKALADDQCWAQISFVPRGYAADRAYVNGTMVGYLDDERVFEFEIETNLDVDRNDEMILTNFKVGDNTLLLPIALGVDMNVFYGCSNYFPRDYERAELDTFITPPVRDAIGITHETLELVLGKALSGYWRKSRAVTDSINYMRYTSDVMAVWEDDVYDRNERGVPKYTIDESQDPPIVWEYLHRKGDPKLDPVTGKQIVKFEAGSLMKDAQGNSIIANPRKIKFRCEMGVFDARYLFSTTKEVRTYREKVAAFVVDTVTDVIPGIQLEMLENTQAFFIPQTTMGYIDARLGDGTIAPIKAENRFTLGYYLTAANRQNTDLIKVIREQTRLVITDWLANNLTISTSDITEALKETLKDSIISVEMEGMGVDKDMRIFTVLSPAARATLGKKLEIEPDGSIGLKDDVVLSYNRHDKTK
ncbi:putative virion structural protein [Erwinia phage vB_EamM_Phobos]|uniref:putative virion structural protein n=1 Tax=Erwinia phage vB_EamM_Phobos TaxID=1883377 RepID=UPI00081D2F88|nr:putative virion structural protein [Erwinia phage vB_EamM_Phobos]ANZ50241.1 putative virion structural protein [Erwinia phage vB_EamM_Phobos]